MPLALPDWLAKAGGPVEPFPRPSLAEAGGEVPGAQGINPNRSKSLQLKS